MFQNEGLFSTLKNHPALKFGFNKKIIAMTDIEIDNKNNAKFNE